jgi:type II secretory pathway pseudopilin PulG
MSTVPLRTSRSEGERGDTLIETMIVMIIFTMILGIVTSAIVSMMRQVDKQTGLADTLSNSRKAIETLDGQVRFANAVTTPGTGTSGDTYVEFRTVQNDQTQLCTQWRYDIAAKGLQYRTWQPPASPPGTVTPTSWTTTALSVTPVSGVPVFSLTPPPGTVLPSPSPGASIPLPHQSLYIDFVTSDGAPVQTSSSQVGITAINSTLGVSTNNTVCQEAGRP